MLSKRAVRWCVLLSVLLWGCDEDSGGGTTQDTQDPQDTQQDTGTSTAPDSITALDTTSPDLTDTTPERVPFGLDARPVGGTCVAPARPPSADAVSLEVAWEGLSFEDPVYMVQAPGDASAWYMVEKPGRVLRFEDRANITQAEVVAFADIRNLVEDGPGEAGLLGMAFHPDWPNTRDVFLSYNVTEGGQLKSVVARWSSTDGGQTLAAGTEQRIITVDQPYGNHNGGQIEFGPDGFLYFSLGDGGSGGDPQGNGQNTQTLLGAMLRLDVSAGGANYEIPADNPFVNDTAAGRPEIYAWGLRNVWRFSFDRDTGTLWAGDVGQGAWEEVDIIERGGNYGWNQREGKHCFVNNCTTEGFIDPIVEHSHNDGEQSITGGYVYHGTQVQGLQGTYVYGDFVSGRVFGVRFNPETEQYEPQLLSDSGLQIASFAQGQDGELYILDFDEGQVHRLVNPPDANPDPTPNGFPQKLSETGCFNVDDHAEPAAGLVPYGVNAPLWSDGANKIRFLSLPPNTTITVDAASGDWTLPIGSVVVKHFHYDGQPVETRLMVRHDDGGWAGYSYAWDNNGQDATLLQGGLKRTVAGNRTWTYPSRSECMSCHTSAAGFTLGLETAQLNGDFVYPDAKLSNQIDTLSHIALFDADPGSSATLPSYPSPTDDTADLDSRARAYLHSNCSHCHRPGGPTNTTHDLQFFASTTSLCVSPTEGSLGLTDPQLIVPGSPERSMLFHRTQRLDTYRMPPLGSDLIDTAATSLLSDWISGMSQVVCNP